MWPLPVDASIIWQLKKAGLRLIANTFRLISEKQTFSKTDWQSCFSVIGSPCLFQIVGSFLQLCRKVNRQSFPCFFLTRFRKLHPKINWFLLPHDGIKRKEWFPERTTKISKHVSFQGTETKKWGDCTLQSTDFTDSWRSSRKKKISWMIGEKEVPTKNYRKKLKHQKKLEKDPGGIRTRGLRIRSPTPSPLGHRVTLWPLLVCRQLITWRHAGSQKRVLLMNWIKSLMWQWT